MCVECRCGLVEQVFFVFVLRLFDCWMCAIMEAKCVSRQDKFLSFLSSFLVCCLQSSSSSSWLSSMFSSSAWLTHSLILLLIPFIHLLLLFPFLLHLLRLRLEFSSWETWNSETLIRETWSSRPQHIHTHKYLVSRFSLGNLLKGWRRETEKKTGRW